MPRDEIDTPPQASTSSLVNIFTPSWRLVSDYDEVMSLLPRFRMPKQYIQTEVDPTAIYKGKNIYCWITVRFDLFCLLELHENLAPRRAFWEKLHSFYSQTSSEMQTYPYVGPFPIDFYQFYNLVISYGGYRAISTKNKVKPTYVNLVLFFFFFFF